MEHVITLLKHLGAEDVPGVPDFNRTTIALGQHLLNPPSVAGWAQGKSWITPALIQERGNVAFDYLFPNITGFRDPNNLYSTASVVGDRLRRGYDYLSATALDDPGMMSMFDLAAKERDELFNTRISTYVGYERAMRKLIPTPRGAAQIDLTQMVLNAGSATTGEAVGLPAGTLPADARFVGHARRAGDVPGGGAGHGGPRACQDVHGRPVAHGESPHHEHAGISD